jgi:predicted CXXCH cytochrome family protein
MKTTCALVLLSLAPMASAGVAGSKHDLSAKGPGPYRAERETDPCIFCHISHGSGTASLSNRPETRAQHQPYESSTMQGRAGAPTGASRICLSCHDGTIALGETRGRSIEMREGNRPIGLERRSNLGTDLRRTHPVSVRASGLRKVRPPAMGDPVHVDGAGLVQCTSCHDPHEEWRDPKVGKFLVKSSAHSAICVSCHATSAAAARATHLSSEARLTNADTGGTDTLGNAGCSACHVSHAANLRGRLLRDGAGVDESCLGCHAKTTRALISLDLSKPSAHRTTGEDRHDAAEGPQAADDHRLPEVSPAATRHVVCVDCHDPHVSSPDPAIGSGIAGALTGVSGVDLAGQWVAAARHEYEICLKCHGDSANKPQASDAGSLGRPRRASADANLRLVFAPTAVSFHPVAASGKNPSVPGLLPPYSPSSTIRCTDCHASDTGPGANAAPGTASAKGWRAGGLKPDLGPRDGAAAGTGARGPHGSTYAPILERQYLTDDFTAESPAAYALCYKCHDREVLLSEASTFKLVRKDDTTVPLHRRHVVEQSAPCSACHAAHGVSREAGNEANAAHLVSFDLSIVKAGHAGALRYETGGVGHGSCALTCHGVKHGQGEPRSAY